VREKKENERGKKKGNEEKNEGREGSTRSGKTVDGDCLNRRNRAFPSLALNDACYLA
jgi:hypothetical protein